MKKSQRLYYKPNIITIDGIDRSGKDTIRRLLVSQSNGNYLVVVRSFISQIVYSRINNRSVSEQFFFDQMKSAFDAGQHFFMLTASDQELADRINWTNEKHINAHQISYHKKIFEEVYMDCLMKHGIHVHLIDTTEKEPIECVNEIVNIIEV